MYHLILIRHVQSGKYNGLSKLGQKQAYRLGQALAKELSSKQIKESNMVCADKISCIRTMDIVSSLIQYTKPTAVWPNLVIPKWNREKYFDYQMINSLLDSFSAFDQLARSSKVLLLCTQREYLPRLLTHELDTNYPGFQDIFFKQKIILSLNKGQAIWFNLKKGQIKYLP